MLGDTTVSIILWRHFTLLQTETLKNNLHRNNINDTIRYDFVADSCGDKIEINEFKSLDVQNGLQMSKISIRAFQFNDFHNGKIFIHCQVRKNSVFSKNQRTFWNFTSQVRACDQNFENCEPVCEDSARRRREIFGEISKLKIASYGPIYFQSDFHHYEFSNWQLWLVLWISAVSTCWSVSSLFNCIKLNNS